MGASRGSKHSRSETEIEGSKYLLWFGCVTSRPERSRLCLLLATLARGMSLLFRELGSLRGGRQRFSNSRILASRGCPDTNLRQEQLRLARSIRCEGAFRNHIVRGCTCSDKRNRERHPRSESRQSFGLHDTAHSESFENWRGPCPDQPSVPIPGVSRRIGRENARQCVAVHRPPPDRWPWMIDATDYRSSNRQPETERESHSKQWHSSVPRTPVSWELQTQPEPVSALHRLLPAE
jgi:hypothetical protein